MGLLQEMILQLLLQQLVTTWLMMLQLVLQQLLTLHLMVLQLMVLQLINLHSAPDKNAYKSNSSFNAAVTVKHFQSHQLQDQQPKQQQLNQQIQRQLQRRHSQVGDDIKSNSGRDSPLFATLRYTDIAKSPINVVSTIHIIIQMGQKLANQISIGSILFELSSA